MIRRERSSESEVSDLDMALRIEQNIGRFEIAVEDIG